MANIQPAKVFYCMVKRGGHHGAAHEHGTSCYVHIVVSHAGMLGAKVQVKGRENGREERTPDRGMSGCRSNFLGPLESKSC